MAETLGGAVRHRRTEAGLTQQGLAKLAGISVRALRDIENGRVRRPHQSVVRRLATALGAAEDPVLAAAAGIVRDTVSARIAVLGPLAVHRGGLPVELASAMQRRLLGLLALRANETVSRDEVVDLLWDDGPPRTYLSALHSHAARLRRTLAPESASRTVLSVRGGYRLTVDASQLDSLRFLELDTAARASQAAGDSKSAAALLAEALGQWRGPVLADGPAGLRNHPVAVALSRRRLAVASSLADIAMEMGVPEQATENLQVLAADEPLHEGLHAKLMLTLAAAGEQSRALAVFAAIQARLADELGVLPGPEIQQAHLLILRQEVPTVAAPAIPAQAARPGVGWIAPAQLPLDVYGFSGRENELAALDALLAAGENQPTAVVISAIMGTAGVGKTALAVHWAHRVRHRFPDGQLYANLGALGANPAEVLRGFLDAFGVPTHRIPVGMEAQVGMYRSLLAGKRVLILLDNAHDADQVRPLLPGTAGCIAVVTSRNQLISLVAAEGAQPLTLDLLPAEEARQLLARRVGRHRLTAEPRAVDEIVAGCVGLPLALTIVAARAATRPGVSLATLAGQILANNGSLDAFAETDRSSDARAVFSWSYQMLGGDAARMFRLLGVHRGPDIAPAAAASLAGVTVPAARGLLTDLANAHLVSEQVRGRYVLHDLLRAYAAELARSVDPEDAREAARRRALDHYLHTAHAADRLLDPARRVVTLPPPEPGVVPEVVGTVDDATAWLDAEHAVLVAAVRQAADAGLDAHVARLAWATSTYLDRRGRWAEWVAVQQFALAAAQRSGDAANEARAHQVLGHAYSRLGRYDDATVSYDRALKLFTELGDRASAGHTHLLLTAGLERAGRMAEALAHAEHALDLYRTIGDARWQGISLNTIGWYHAKLGDYARALECCGEALAMLQTIGDRHGQAATQDSLGYIHDQLGDHRLAIDHFRQAVVLFREIGGRYFEADVLARLGDAHLSSGDLESAHDVWQQALKTFDEFGHPDADSVRAKIDAVAH